MTYFFNAIRFPSESRMTKIWSDPWIDDPQAGHIAIGHFIELPNAQDEGVEGDFLKSHMPFQCGGFGGVHADGNPWLFVLQHGHPSASTLVADDSDPFWAMRDSLDRALSFNSGARMTQELRWTRADLIQVYADRGVQPDVVRSWPAAALLRGLLAECCYVPLRDVADGYATGCAFPGVEHACEADVFTDVFVRWAAQQIPAPSAVSRAQDLATIAHEGQRDRAGQPCIEHLERVVGHLVDPSEVETIVAWLHHFVEDTRVTLEDIRQSFGTQVADAVDAITRRSREIDLNYYARVKANPNALTVKTADLADLADRGRLLLVAPKKRTHLRAEYAAARIHLGIENHPSQAGDVTEAQVKTSTLGALSGDQVAQSVRTYQVDPYAALDVEQMGSIMASVGSGGTLDKWILGHGVVDASETAAARQFWDAIVEASAALKPGQTLWIPSEWD